MREIKFRAWDNDKMDYSPATYVSDTSSINDAISNYVNAGTQLMQYTGLKDKNGVEIYEGDVLSGNFIVVWHDNGFYLHQPEIFNDTFYMPFTDRYKAEVIGNIYENGDLLK